MERVVQRIFVPTINDAGPDFTRLHAIWTQLSGAAAGAIFDFSQCNFLRPNAVAFLGGAARHAESMKKIIEFDWSSVQRQIFTNLCQNGFAHAFGHAAAPWNGHSIQYREDLCANPNHIADYLTDQWLGRGWLNVSHLLRDEIVGRVWEIYANSFEHAKSPVGVFSCGQYFKTQNELILTVVDFGTGIPSKVRAYLDSFQTDQPRPIFPSSALMRWAFAKGNTTARGTVPRGLGLELLKQFVRINGGSLEVYSEDCYAIIDEGGERYSDLPIKFPGTTVKIKLICDAKYYRLASELQANE